MTVGELIKKKRLEQGLTQKQLGERAKIAEPTIRRYELGKLNPKYETIQKIAAALGVNPLELFPQYSKELASQGQRLQESIIAKNMSIDQLAEKSNVAVKDIEDYVNGIKAPNFYAIQEICSILEIDIGYLTDGIPFDEKISIVDKTFKTEISGENKPLKKVFEFNNFAKMLNTIGYCLTLSDDEQTYYITDEKKEVPITEDEIKSLSRASRAAVRGIVDDFMRQDKTPT